MTEAGATEARTPFQRALVGPHGLRAGWRVALWLLLFASFLQIGIMLIGALGAERTIWGSFGAMLFAATLAGWIMLYGIDRRPIGALGFAADPAAARDTALGWGIGGGLLAGAVVLLAVAGTARWVADAGSGSEYAAVLVQAAALFWVAAAAEEAVFRGYAFQALVQGMGAWPATVLTSALFAYAHRGNQNVDWIALANIFLAGGMLAVAYLKTRSLWFATAVHAGWNWAMSALLDFPVSGLQRDTPLYSAVETGADWWTGGPFGPEAGLAATLAVVLGTAWMLRTRLLRESPRMRAARPLVDSVLEERWPTAAR